MKYKTDLHCHSAEVSDCANASAAVVVDKYLRAGYDAVVLTNHLSRNTFKNHPELDTWDKKIDFFMSGYRKLCAVAPGRLNILLGAEVRFNDAPGDHNDRNDYLIYGITESFMRAHPDLLDMTVSKLVELTRKEGFLLVQAHPFRDDMRIIRPDLLDGMEVYNCHTAHATRNDIAFQWAARYNLVMTSGSDLHDPDNLIGAGIATDFPITSSEMLVWVLKSRCYDLIREGMTL